MAASCQPPVTCRSPSFVQLSVCLSVCLWLLLLYWFRPSTPFVSAAALSLTVLLTPISLYIMGSYSMLTDFAILALSASSLLSEDNLSSCSHRKLATPFASPPSPCHPESMFFPAFIHLCVFPDTNATVGEALGRVLLRGSVYLSLGQ